jgi:hypothetical protein
MNHLDSLQGLCSLLNPHSLAFKEECVEEEQTYCLTPTLPLSIYYSLTTSTYSFNCSNDYILILKMSVNLV